MDTCRPYLQRQIELLSRETPAQFVAFDLLALGDEDVARGEAIACQARPCSDLVLSVARGLAHTAAPVADLPGIIDRLTGPAAADDLCGGSGWI